MEIAQHLANDMAREDLKGKTLTLKLKTTAFEVRTRAHSLPQYISSFDEIIAPAMRLLKAEMPIEIRLMGMRMSHFLEVRKDAGQKSIASFVQTKVAGTAGLYPLKTVQYISTCCPAHSAEKFLLCMFPSSNTHLQLDVCDLHGSHK